MPISQIVTNSIASGQTITSPVIAGTPTGVGVLTLGTAQASTSGTSIDFTSIPSWVKRITIMFNGVSTNGTSFPQVQIGSGSVSTTGYATGTSITVNGGTSGVTAETTGFCLTNSGGAAYVFRGTLVLTLFSGNTWAGSGLNTITTGAFNTVAGISPALSGALDRVRITTTNGTDTFDAGSINILYE